MKHCKKLAAIASALLVLGFTACSSDGDGGSGSNDSTQAGIPATGKPAGTTPKTKTTEVSKPTGATGITGSTGTTANGTPTTNRTPSPNGLVKPTYKTVYNVTEDTYVKTLDEIIARLNANDPSQPKEFEFKFSGTKPITFEQWDNNARVPDNKMSELFKAPHADVHVGLDFSSAKVDKAFIERGSMFLTHNFESIVLPQKIDVDWELGNYYFQDCRCLKYIKFPDNLKKVGEYITFCSNNDNPGSLEFEIPNTIKSLNNYAFCAAKHLKKVVFNEGLEEIGEYAFMSCIKLVNVNLPSTLKTIKYKAFSDCSELKNISLNNGLEEIGENAFDNCTSLETIELPSSILSIGDAAFENTKLKKVIIPESVDTIGSKIFWNCNELEVVEIRAPKIGTDVLAGTNVKSLVIGEKVIEIGTGNFVSTLTSVVFKNPEGWKCDGVPVDSAILKDPAAAATYLKTNKDKVFTRQ